MRAISSAETSRPGTAHHTVRFNPPAATAEKNAGPSASPMLPLQMNHDIARARFVLMWATALEAACGWKEATPAPPRNTISATVQNPGASPRLEMNTPAMAGDSAVKKRERNRSERYPYTGWSTEA